jgi:hypothetical protein
MVLFFWSDLPSAPSDVVSCCKSVGICILFGTSAGTRTPRLTVWLSMLCQTLHSFCHEGLGARAEVAVLTVLLCSLEVGVPKLFLIYLQFIETCAPVYILIWSLCEQLSTCPVIYVHQYRIGSMTGRPVLRPSTG